jgi:hypothetical protein
MMASVSPLADPAAAIDRLATHSSEVVANSLVRQRVLRQSLALIDDRAPLLGEQIRTVGIVKWRLPIVSTVGMRFSATVALIGRHITELEIPVWLIKGSASRSLYADPESREMGDVDIMVRSASEAFQLAGRLVATGYGFASGELPWMKVTAGSVPFGGLNLRHRSPESWPNIDIHYGGYPVMHGAVLPPPNGNSPGVTLPDAAENLAYLVANAANDYAITAKDLNDITLALSDETTDWQRLLGRLQASDIDSFFGVLLDRINLVSRLPPQGHTRLGVLRRQCRRLPVWPATELSWKDHWRRRWLAHVEHAFRHARRRSLVHALRVAWSAARFHWTPVGTEVVAGKRRARPRLRKMNQWTVTWLVPLATVTDPAVQWGSVEVSSPGLSAALPSRPLWVAPKDLTIASTRFGDVILSTAGTFIPCTTRKIPLELVSFLTGARS